jgi:hypothetical protein
MVMPAEVGLLHPKEAPAQELAAVVLTNAKRHPQVEAPRAKVPKIDQIGRAELLVRSTMTSLKAP